VGSRSLWLAVLVVLGFNGAMAPLADAGAGQRPRLIVLTDIGGDQSLTSRKWIDPDGDTLSCRWWVYDEASHYPRATVELRGADRAEAALGVPRDTLHLHVILEVTDDGEPPLTSYRRVVIRTR